MQTRGKTGRAFASTNKEKQRKTANKGGRASGNGRSSMSSNKNGNSRNSNR